MLALYFILLLASIPVWFWLCLRIKKVSPLGAVLSFFLGLPALYWAYKLWDDSDAKIRPPFLSYAALTILITLIGMQLPENWAQNLVQGSAKTNKLKLAAEKKQKDGAMERWCNEKNDAAYDPDLKTCVERGKSEALSKEASVDLYGRLTKHLEHSGIKGEFDHSKTAASVKLTATPEIASVAAYYFWPLSMSQPQVSVFLCVSESACATFVENSKDREILIMLRKGNLLLVIPVEGKDDARIKELETAFSTFKATRS